MNLIQQLKSWLRPYSVSSCYVELDLREAMRQWPELSKAWDHPNIAEEQRVLACKQLSDLRKPPFSALIESVNVIQKNDRRSNGNRKRWHRDNVKTILEIGCGIGQNSKALAWFRMQYTGYDTSVPAVEMARYLYSQFGAFYSSSLPIYPELFDTVLDGGCLLHNLDYEALLRTEAASSARYVILHRVPLISGYTRYYRKLAYGHPCLEIHFSQREFMDLIARAGLRVLHRTEVYDGNMRSFACEKVAQ